MCFTLIGAPTDTSAFACCCLVSVPGPPSMNWRMISVYNVPTQLVHKTRALPHSLSHKKQRHKSTPCGIKSHVQDLNEHTIDKLQVHAHTHTNHAHIGSHIHNTYKCTCANTSQAHKHAHTQTHTHTHTSTHTHTHTSTRTHVCIFAHIPLRKMPSMRAI